MCGFQLRSPNRSCVFLVMPPSHMVCSQQSKNDAFITQVRLLFLGLNPAASPISRRGGVLTLASRAWPPAPFLILSLAHSPATSTSLSLPQATHTQTSEPRHLSCHEDSLHPEICSVFAQMLHSLMGPSMTTLTQSYNPFSKYSHFSLLGSIFFYLYSCKKKYFTMVKVT